jgi:hypothetical protein
MSAQGHAGCFRGLAEEDSGPPREIDVSEGKLGAF